MIGVVVVALLACAAIVYVALPLRGADEDPTALPDALEEARENKTAALTAIIDLEEEAQVGKLSQADVDVLRPQYEREALAALEQMDALTTSRDVDVDPLEAEIEAMRRRLACPSCGRVREPGATCSRCGV